MLRWAGGKQRAIPTLLSYIPNHKQDIVSPFFGGGSLERALQSRGHRILASDIDNELVNYWNVLHESPAELKAHVQSLFPASKDSYLQARATISQGTPLERASRFFFVNRCCFSGVMTGGYSGARFTQSAIDSILKTPAIPLNHLDYEEALAQHPTSFAYLDPPYDVPNLYRSEPFHHERLAELLKHRQSPWVLSYNDTPKIRALYEGWCWIEPVEWTYGMNKTKQSNEIVIIPIRKRRLNVKLCVPLPLFVS